MPKPSKVQYMSVQEYIVFEEKSPVKHEYVDGRVHAMTGARKNHNIVAQNVARLLHSHLRASKCQAYISELKVHVKATNSIYYPDVAVDCGPFRGNDQFAETPVLIVEVLSRSTEKIDRREKALAYKQVSSVREYMMINQRRRRVELHRRSGEGNWQAFELLPGTQLILESLPPGPLSMSIEDIYEGTDVPEQGLAVKEGNAKYLDEGAEEDW